MTAGSLLGGQPLHLTRFATVDAPEADLVTVRYFIGFAFEAAAEVLGLAVITAKQWWAYLRAWLRVELQAAKAK